MTITLTREEAQQVLDALEKVTKQMLSARDELGERGGRPVTNTHHQKIWDRASEAYTDQAIPAAETLRARLERSEVAREGPVREWARISQAEPEPVMLMDAPLLLNSQPLYTAPPQREQRAYTVR